MLCNPISDWMDIINLIKFILKYIFISRFMFLTSRQLRFMSVLNQYLIIHTLIFTILFFYCYFSFKSRTFFNLRYFQFFFLILFKRIKLLNINIFIKICIFKIFFIIGNTLGRAFFIYAQWIVSILQIIKLFVLHLKCFSVGVLRKLHLAERLLSPWRFTLTLAFSIFFNVFILVLAFHKGFGYTLRVSLAALGKLLIY